MVRYSIALYLIALVATVVVAIPLGLFFAIPIANLVASLLVTVAMIGLLVLQRRGIGPKRSLLKQQYFLYAVFGPVLICLLMLQDYVDRWLGVPPRHISILGLALLLAIWWGLMYFLPRIVFSAEERAELKAKGKAIRATEKFWASRTPVSAVPGARKLRGLFSGRS